MHILHRISIPLFVLLLTGNAAFSGNRCNSLRPQNIQIVQYKTLDVNTIKCVLGSDGPFADFRLTSHAGLEWPNGSGKTAVYSAGIWVAGIHTPSQKLRTACMEYDPEYQPGPLLEPFNTTTNNDSLPVSRAGDSRYRLYKITKGDTLAQDYVGWPGDLGAPFVDVNGNGVWDPGTDKPRFYGDQQVWCVINDVDSADHWIAMTPPMGLEVQILYYAFNQPGPLGQSMFMQWKIINKSDANYDNVYLGIWADVDLGDGNDDLPGSDSTLDLGFAYNGSNTDAIYGSPPPACGFSILCGPAVPGAPGDSAIVSCGWRKGFRNLSATSSLFFTCGPPVPCVNIHDTTTARGMYEAMKGMLPATHQYITDPATGGPMLFWCSGDPVAGTGDLPANFPLGAIVPRDIYILLNSGPFSLASGDTQVTTGSFVIAKGTDRLNSVTLLKQYEGAIRTSFVDGAIVADVRPPVNQIPGRFELEQNYPNPFNPSTEIRFQITDYSKVTLRVYDILGREVATLVNEPKASGSYGVRFDGSGLASGVYFYRLQSGSFTAIRKLVLLR